jgi:hypothetical protein
MIPGTSDVIPPHGHRAAPSVVWRIRLRRVAGRQKWRRLTIAAILFYLLKGIVWLGIGWLALAG